MTIIDTDTGEIMETETVGSLLKLEEASRYLAEVKSVDEVKDIRDKAEAMRVYAKQARLGLESQNYAAEIKLRAERRAGELLAEIPRVDPNQARWYPDHAQEPDSKQTYTEIIRENGIHPQKAINWQKIAAVPDPDFEAHIAETKASGNELTTSGILRVIRPLEPTAPDPHAYNSYDDDGNTEYEYRYNGGYAYCKYCYETHNRWDLVDFPVWECKHCGHRTNDEFMQLVSDEDGQRYDLKRQQREKQEADFLDAAIEENRKRDNAALFTSHTDEWNTPQEILRRVLAVMDEIDLDPCSNSEESPNVPAAQHYTEDMNGLTQEWRGRVYMNPPYGDVIGDWVEKLVGEYRAGRVTQALALVPARTDTQWFREFREFPRCFIIGRLKFGDATNSAPFPSVVISLGCDHDRFLEVFGEIGDVYELAALND